MLAVSDAEILVERALPQQTEVREHDGLVDAHLGETIGARRRVPVVAREVVVVARLGREAGADAFAAVAQLAREAGVLHVDRPELAIGSPAQPRIAELVVDDAQHVVAVTRVDVVEPRRARLVEVLVGVDHGRQRNASSHNLTPMSSLHGLTLGDVLREHRRSRPDQVAAVDGDVRLTYAGLDERVEPAGQRTRSPPASGPATGSLWLGQNSFRVIETLLAAAKIGAVLLRRELAAVGRRDGVRARRPPPRWSSIRPRRSATPSRRASAVVSGRRGPVGAARQRRVRGASSRRARPTIPIRADRSRRTGAAHVHGRVLGPPERGDALAHRARSARH